MAVGNVAIVVVVVVGWFEVGVVPLLIVISCLHSVEHQLSATTTEMPAPASDIVFEEIRVS